MSYLIVSKLIGGHKIAGVSIKSNRTLITVVGEGKVSLFESEELN